MTIAASILDELRACGAAAYHRDGQIRIRPAGLASPDLMARIRQHRAELVEILRGERPPAEPDMPFAPEWIVPSDGPGTMRLAVCDPPEAWPRHDVHRAAALVDQVDAHHRAGRDREAGDAARELEALLVSLGRQGIAARLTCS